MLLNGALGFDLGFPLVFMAMNAVDAETLQADVDMIYNPAKKNSHPLADVHKTVKPPYDRNHRAVLCNVYRFRKGSLV